MATFGLKVVGGPGKPGMLSEIFKNAFGDPDLKAKLANISSEIWQREHQNQYYDQQAEYARQQGIKTAQEAADLKAKQEALGIAGPAAGDILAGGVPEVSMPVPVIGPRLAPDPVSQGAFAGAQPGIVPPVNYDARMAQRAIDQENWRKLGPAIVQSASGGADLASGVGKGLGAAGLSAPSTPEAARRSAILYGVNPTTSTVVTAGDTAGTDAAAQQAIQETAGKLPSEIALEQAKAKAKADAEAAASPLGSSGSGPAAYRLAVLTAKEKTPEGLTPQEQQEKIQTQAIVDKANAVTPGKDAPIYEPDGTGGWRQVGGPTVDPNAPTDPYSSNAVGADSKNIIIDTMYRMQTGQPIPLQRAIAYRTAYESEHPNKKTVVKDTNTGQTFEYPPAPPPPDLPTPDEVDAAVTAGRSGPSVAPGGAAPTLMPPEIARLGVSPPGGTPVRPAFVGRKTLGNGLTPLAELSSPPIGTEFQQKSRTFSAPLINATLDLDKITPETLPGRLQAAVINATSGAQSGGTSILGEYGNLTARDWTLGGGDDPSRIYERALNAYIGPELYQLSGMAIKPEEFARQMSANAPAYGDGPETLARKTVDRHNFIKAVVDGGYAGNDAEKTKVYALAAQGGLDLTNFTLYDGNKTAMMPPQTAAQLAAITRGLQGAPDLTSSAIATPAAAGASAAPTTPVAPATPAGPAAPASLPAPEPMAGVDQHTWETVIWPAMAKMPGQQQKYLDNLEHIRRARKR